MNHKIKTLEEYEKKLNEDFYNPFEKTDVEVKPSHIADKGGLFKLRKETFNINRVEYSKRANGDFTVLARTQFAKGEIVEISPVIIVGMETKAVPRLKDYIFEIDKNKQIYGVVLGYGSLYRHSPNPNIIFAYNKGNKQMYFMSGKTIKAGEELTIDYGKDYFAERQGFGEIGKIEKPQGEAIVKGETSEGMGLQQNVNDITQEMSKKQFSQPNDPNNPTVSGVALRAQQ
jgi:hypothetical protein